MDDITPPKNRATPMATSQPGQTPLPSRPFGADVAPAPKVPAATPAPRPIPISSPEPVDPSEEARKPIFSDGGPAATEQAPGSAPQKGAGLDLSSLSDEDADDLGIPRPSESPGEAAVRRAKEDYPTGRPKKHGKGGVIVAAILIVLCLIGGAGYAYWQNSKETPVPAPTQTTKATTQTTTAKVTGKDVDSATKDIDASLNKVNDTTDFTANDLSDATLGL